MREHSSSLRPSSQPAMISARPRRNWVMSLGMTMPCSARRPRTWFTSLTRYDTSGGESDGRPARPTVQRISAARSAHGRPADRFTERFRIVAVVLVRLDVWRHELRADQPHLMAKRGEHASPIMRSVRSLHADQTRPQIGEEAGHRIATQPLSHNDIPVLVDAVNIDDILRLIATYRTTCMTSSFIAVDVRDSTAPRGRGQYHWALPCKIVVQFVVGSLAIICTAFECGRT